MLEISAKMRRETGRHNDQLRQQGFIPAILYGHKVKNISLSVGAKEFRNIYDQAGENTLVKVKIKGGGKMGEKERVVLIHDATKDPLNDKFIHIDFYQVKMNESIRAEVPLVFISESLAVTQENGLLVKNVQEVEIEALPQDLIHEIEVDISPLKTFDENIHIKDLKVSEKIKIIAEPEDIVATVVPPRTAEELEDLETPPEERVEEVEVEGEEKKAEKEEAEEKIKEVSETEK